MACDDEEDLASVARRHGRHSTTVACKDEATVSACPSNVSTSSLVSITTTAVDDSDSDHEWQPSSPDQALSRSTSVRWRWAAAVKVAHRLALALGSQSDQVVDPEDVRELLHSILLHLGVLWQDCALPCDEARDVVSHLLAANVPARLVSCIGVLEFESRKYAVKAFDAVLRLGMQLGIDTQVVEYMQSQPQVMKLLLEGSGEERIYSYCAHMLRSCTRCAQLVRALHAEGAAKRLIELSQHQNFDISSEAFFSLQELLLAHKAACAPYVEANFGEFFGHYHALLQTGNYVIRRQALNALGLMLLDPSFMIVMVDYVSNSQFLQAHMKLLLDTSAAIRVGAFHVFKIFVANPHKPLRMQAILYQNRYKLIKLLKALRAKRQCDVDFDNDLETVINALWGLRPPRSGPPEQSFVRAVMIQANSST